MQTEYKFSLARGYEDSNGKVYQTGSMRLARAMDEIEAYQVANQRGLSEYASVVVLSKVVSLDGLEMVTTDVIEALYTIDYQQLQSLYETINQGDAQIIPVTCPHCGKNFDIDHTF